ncbi:sulfotransferase domain-containing protein [Candidatus Pelagibacter sp.]|uniref:sulfotransferase domain-containing protein n=1 Tax=Candidatus Pelagibacter sp. TaxID=2024849 RepID=UPI003F82D646
MIIWIASYPKSGNTWVRSFVIAYYFCENGIFDVNKLNLIQDYPNKQFFKETVKKNEIHKHWDSSQKNICNEKKVKFLKTHNSLITAFGNDFTKPEYSLGVIHVIRDPRNIITSLKNHYDFETYERALKFMQDENKILEDYPHLKNYAKTNIINSWRINYQSWMSNKNFRRLTIRYEDMIKDPHQTFKKLVVFINTLMRFKDKIDPKKFSNAIETTNFKSLQDIENQGKFSENVYSLKDNKKIKFFYQGPENDWKKNLDENMIKKMNEYYKKDLKFFRYEN